MPTRFESGYVCKSYTVECGEFNDNLWIFLKLTNWTNGNRIHAQNSNLCSDFFPPCSLYIHSLWYQKKKHDAWILRFKKLNTFFYRSVAGLTNWSTVKVSGWAGPAAGRRLYTHTHPVEAETLERSWWRRLENNGRLVWTSALVLSQSLCVSGASEGAREWFTATGDVSVTGAQP